MMGHMGRVRCRDQRAANETDSKCEVHIVDGTGDHFDVALLLSNAHNFLVKLLGSHVSGGARCHLNDGLARGLALRTVNHMNALIHDVLALFAQEVQHILYLRLKGESA